MNDSPACPKCGSKLGDTPAVGVTMAISETVVMPAKSAYRPPRGISLRSRSSYLALSRLQQPSEPDEGRFLPGDLVAGRYRMIGLIGRGGMGEVYRATT